MANDRKSRGSSAIERAAEEIGNTLGSIVGRIDALQAEHPHPVDEAREALATGQEALASVASQARTRATTAVKKARAVVHQTKKAAARLRPKRKPLLVRAAGAAKKAAARLRPKRKPPLVRAAGAAKKAAGKAMKRTTKAVARGRKRVARAARRLKR